jgi:hypothetical protein
VIKFSFEGQHRLQDCAVLGWSCVIANVAQDGQSKAIIKKYCIQNSLFFEESNERRSIDHIRKSCQDAGHLNANWFQCGIDTALLAWASNFPEVFEPRLAELKNTFLDAGIFSEDFAQLEFQLREIVKSVSQADVSKVLTCLIELAARINDKERRMTTKTENYNIYGQAGAVGPHAVAANNSFAMNADQVFAGINLATLSNELSTLRDNIRKEARTIDHDRAVVAVGDAASAAKIGDQAGLLAHLKSAGKWSFDIASKIGTSVAAKAIEKALGV